MYIEFIKDCEEGNKGDRISATPSAGKRLIEEGKAKEIHKPKGL